MSDSGICELEATRRFREVKKGEILFRQGDEPEYLLCLYSGVVSLTCVNERGDLNFVGWARAGEPLGFQSLISGEPYRYQGQAASPCGVCQISRGVFKEALKEESVNRRVLLKLNRAAEEAEKRYLSLLHRSAHERVAELLLDLQCLDQGRFQPRRQEFAQLAGVRPATLSRILKDFHKQGFIPKGPRWLRILDEEGLQRFSRGGQTDDNC